jgi:glucokinase-like ROK family protein
MINHHRFLHGKHHHIFKKKNILAVINVLKQENRLTRPKIARMTNLTPGTVSKVIHDLEVAEIVHTVGPGESSGGRRPKLIEFRPDAFYLLGLDIGYCKIIFVILDLHGNIISSTQTEFKQDSKKEDIVKTIFRLISHKIEEANLSKKKIAGLGISFPGTVDSDKGCSLKAPNLPVLNDLPIINMFRDEFSFFMCLENDARALTFGEAIFGSGIDSKNILGVTLGRRIGSGIIINGDLYRGAYNRAGDIGHMIVNQSGPMCSCGNRGCLEVMSSGLAISYSAMRIVDTGIETELRQIAENTTLTAEIISKAADNGDGIAKSLMTDSAKYIGTALSNVNKLLNPELIIIGGGLVTAGEYFLEEIKEAYNLKTNGLKTKVPELKISKLGENASAIGAAAIAFFKVFDRSYT